MTTEAEKAVLAALSRITFQASILENGEISSMSSTKAFSEGEIMKVRVYNDAEIKSIIRAALQSHQNPENRHEAVEVTVGELASILCSKKLAEHLGRLYAGKCLKIVGG